MYESSNRIMSIRFDSHYILTLVKKCCLLSTYVLVSISSVHAPTLRDCIDSCRGVYQHDMLCTTVVSKKILLFL